MNDIEILINIKENNEKNQFEIDKIFLLNFEFNYNFFAKICKDIFQKPILQMNVDDNYKKNLIGNNRIFDNIKKNQNFDDLVIALDFYKKILNTNLTNSNYDLESNKITCFLKSFFY